MNSRVNATRVFGLVAAILLGPFAASEAMAQSDTRSGFASRSLDVIKNRNSANFYTSENIRRQNISTAVPPVGVGGVNRQSFLTAGPSRRPVKPFSSINRTPAVSPYLALNNSINTASDYYSIVRPQQEQRRRNQQLQRQVQDNQRRIGEYTARAPFSPQGNQYAAPTGHAAVFQSLGSYLTTGNYFPPPTQPKSRR